jgi:alpha-L-rhamnosidase
MSENQNPEGSMPNIVPPLEGTRINSAPNWETAYPMILWNMMMYYGDSELIYNHHDSLVRYFDALDSNYRETGLKFFRTGYGDWVPPRGQPKSDLHLMGSFALLGDVKLGIDIFRYSNHPDSESQLNRLIELRSKISPEFHDTFFNSTSGVYMSGLQTEQVLPLYLGVVPHELKASILSSLIDDIQIKQEGHTTSGIVGIKYAMEVLSSLDRGDVALDLALQTSYPSWGYMIKSQYEPATTVWELWESDTAGPTMNSRNHHMFGSISGWFYKHVAGIKPLEPGFSRVQIRPNLLRHQNFTIRVSTPYGYVSLNYRKQEDMENGNQDKATTTRFFYELELPPCTSGIFHIPVALDDSEMKSDEDSTNVSIEESGVPIWLDWQYLPDVDGVKYVEKVGKYIHVKITNGKYRFKVTASKISSGATKV